MDFKNYFDVYLDLIVFRLHSARAIEVISK